MKSLLRFLLFSLAVLVLSAGVFTLDFFKRNNLVIPRIALGDLSLDGMQREAVRTVIRERLQKFTSQPIQIVASGEIQSVTLANLGVFMDESQILDEIPFAGTLSNPEILFWSLAGRRIFPRATIERTEIIRVIDEKFPAIPKTKNAHFVRNGKTLVVAEAEKGLKPNIESALSQIQQNILFLEHKPLFIDFRESAPEILAADIERNKQAILANFPHALTLASDKKTWEVNFDQHPEWILFDKKPYEVAAGELPFSLGWDPLAFSNFLQSKVSLQLEQAPESVRIWRDENDAPMSHRGANGLAELRLGLKDKIQFDGHGNDGRKIERERLLTLANQAISRKIAQVEVPLSVVPAKVEISQDLQQLGIRELLATGYTRFEGSPVNRTYNIGVGIARFHGLVIEPGETFSFDKNLGKVDETTGYRKELVIKPEGTIPEFGGGLCQVSSTMYRAAVFAGLPIVERVPHSYAVTYYAQVGGHGLDATIYPPSRDLKFTNDTSGVILIQAYVDGPSAYFKFYGTSDGRVVKMDGPYISNRIGASTEPLLVPDPKLKPGEKKQVEKAHGGFDALWYRYITKGLETKQEKIVSHYRATQNKFLVGGEVASGTSSDATVNPFE